MPTEAPQSLCAGLDLHKHNVFCGLIDQEGKPIYRRRLPAELPTILQALTRRGVWKGAGVDAVPCI